MCLLSIDPAIVFSAQAIKCTIAVAKDKTARAMDTIAAGAKDTIEYFCFYPWGFELGT